MGHCCLYILLSCLPMTLPGASLALGPSSGKAPNACPGQAQHGALLPILSIPAMARGRRVFNSCGCYRLPCTPTVPTHSLTTGVSSTLLNVSLGPLLFRVPPEPSTGFSPFSRAHTLYSRSLA